MVIHILIIRKIPGIFSSGISFCIHSLFVIALKLKRMKIANIKKATVYKKGTLTPPTNKQRLYK